MVDMRNAKKFVSKNKKSDCVRDTGNDGIIIYKDMLKKQRLSFCKRFMCVGM
jgi:hypothetical protein